MRTVRRLLSAVSDVIGRPILAYLGYFKKAPISTGVEESSYYSNFRRADNLFAIHRGYLATSGWLESKHRNASVIGGEFVPWITYPALAFLKHLDLKGKHVVEFGAGASTVWFSHHAASVSSYEFDPEFLDRNRPFLGESNVTLKAGPSSGPRVESQGVLSLPEDLLNLFNRDVLHAHEFEVELKFELDSSFVDEVVEDLKQADLVFIDGGPRNLAAGLAAIYTSPDCLVIVDNSDFEYLGMGISFLRSVGFTEIPFEGLGPLNPYGWRTSLFIRKLSGIV